MSPANETNTVQLQIGDPVIVTGNVEFKGKTGDIKAFDSAHSFAIVDLHDHGPRSYHVSDIEYDDAGAEQDDSDEADQEQFFVVIVAGDDDEPFIGRIEKSNGRWSESSVSGPEPHKWGGNYMSYLSPDEIVSWMRKDYQPRLGVDGPYDTEQQARQAAGMLDESPAPETPVTTPKSEPKLPADFRVGDRYEPDEFDQMVGRLRKLAGAGPLKTVWDPERRVYRNMPTAQQPTRK